MNIIGLQTQSALIKIYFRKSMLSKTYGIRLTKMFCTKSMLNKNFGIPLNKNGKACSDLGKPL